LIKLAAGVAVEVKKCRLVAPPLAAADIVVATVKLPNVEMATTRAAIVEVTALDPATTLARLEPFEITTVPEVSDVIVGLLDSVTVATEDRATVLLVRVT